MAGKLAYTVHVRHTEPVDAKRPERGVNVVREETFLAGQELPEWAWPHVGSHVYEEGEVPEAAAAEGSAPAGNASLEAWQDYARSKGAADADIDGKTRDELREQFGA